MFQKLLKYIFLFINQILNFDILDVKVGAIVVVVGVCGVVVVGVVGMVVVEGVVAPILFRTLNMKVVTKVVSKTCLNVYPLCC